LYGRDISRESDIQVDDKMKELFPEHVSIRGKVNNYSYHSIYYKKKRNIKKSPAIIISSNGMSDNGPILEHLKNYLKDKENVILLTGYQANHTNGYKLIDMQNMTKKQKEVDELSLDVHNTKYKEGDNEKKFIKEYIRYSDIKAQVIELKDYYSGHADQETLIDYVFNKNLIVYL